MTTAYATHERFPEHDISGHPEHAGRIRAVWQRLQETGLAARMQPITPEPLALEYLAAVHTQDYLTLLEKISAQPQTVRLDSDTYVTPTSFEIARLSAGGVVAVTDAVLRGAAHNGLAAVRPPGHHALAHIGMGFCLFGNIVIAARYAQQQYGLERILILDYDVHHGNGTEAMLYDDPSVLFISLHQHPFYPFTGAAERTGSGKGKGFNINIPLSAGHGDQNYAALYESIVWKAAERFQPELILVSAGFDAHWLDPLADIRLTIQGFAHMNRELIRMAEHFCGGKIVVAMEGGYNLDALSYGMCATASTLLGDTDVIDPLGNPNDGRREPPILPVIDLVKRLHQL